MRVYPELLQHVVQQPFPDFAMLHDGPAGAVKQGLMASLAMGLVDQDGDTLGPAKLLSPPDEFLAIHLRS